MQLLQPSVIIDEIDKKDELARIISDKYCRSILESIMHKPKSCTEITAETTIPISTVYRRIQMLHDINALKTSGAINEDGKKLFLYKSKIKAIRCNFNDGKIEVEVTLNQ